MISRHRAHRSCLTPSFIHAVCLGFWLVMLPAAEVEAHSPHAGHSHAHGDPVDSEGHDLNPKSQWLLLAGYGFSIMLASLGGGAIPGRLVISHNRMQHLVSLISGLMLGIAVFHLLPHALQHLGSESLDDLMAALMAGIVTMFFLLRAFHFHQHEMPDVTVPSTDVSAMEAFQLRDSTVAKSDSPETFSNSAFECRHTHSSNDFSWMGVFLGMGLHTLIDGIALGASIQAELEHHGVILAGLGTFVAIVLHQPLDSMSFTALMTTSHWPRWTIRAANVVFALLCPLGAALLMAGVNLAGGGNNAFIALALAFSAGVFLSIALSDLLPEMEFHSHNRLSLTACLLCGLALAWAIGFLESDAAHGHPSGAFSRTTAKHLRSAGSVQVDLGNQGFSMAQPVRTRSFFDIFHERTGQVGVVGEAVLPDHFGE